MTKEFMIEAITQKLNSFSVDRLRAVYQYIMRLR